MSRRGDVRVYKTDVIQCGYDQLERSTSLLDSHTRPVITSGQSSSESGPKRLSNPSLQKDIHGGV
eukprot:scaffold223_cov408-Prasinococcus_capsulatus_cf.AAC.15